MMVNGVKEKIKPFPHYSGFVYRTKQFFCAKSLSSHMIKNRFFTIGELYRSYREKTSLPRCILLDPTTDCNLKCKGCWANDYDKGIHLSLEKMDEVITEGKKLGINSIRFTGGEPLMRKDDILRLMKKHPDVAFAAYTNGTLVDEDFADQIKEMGNLLLYISIEGTQEETDFRRGNGVYDRVIKAMDILKSKNIAFAFSACYHAKNYKTIASDEFLQFMRDKGCWFGWLFQYVPIGQDADLSLVCSAEQRAYVQRKISHYCKEQDYMIIDFWNNGHVAFGCIGGGTGFVHINARGDVEPCAFCHYSDANIHDVSLTQALKSDFFTAFRLKQPFSTNPLRPCPMLDHPQVLNDIIDQTGAISTHMSCPESGQELALKTKDTAKEWKDMAEVLYNEMDERQRTNFPKFLRYYAFRKKITDERRVKNKHVHRKANQR